MTAGARRAREIMLIAHMTLGGRGPALAFLNTVHVQLRGRPLDLARASEEGWVKVKRAIYDFANRMI
jgi:hypothetical protein